MFISNSKRPNIVCTSCGVNFTEKHPRKAISAIMSEYFYYTNSSLYKFNQNRTTVCQVCINNLFADYIAKFENKMDAFYYLCAVFGWYFNLKLFREVENEPNLVVRYIQRINLGKANPNKVKSFADTLAEEAKNPKMFVALEERKFIDEENRKVYNHDWRGEYTPKEIEYLENYYKGLKNDYKITTENHRDYARKIAKASLFMDICYDEILNNTSNADYGQYSKARENFDTLCKSAKFAEQSRSVNDVGLGAFGAIADKVEKGEYIYKHTPVKKDEVDEMLKYFLTIKDSLG